MMLVPLQSGFLWRMRHHLLLLRTLCPVYMRRSFRYFVLYPSALTLCCETMLPSVHPSEPMCLHGQLLHTDPPGISTKVWLACVV